MYDIGESNRSWDMGIRRLGVVSLLFLVVTVFAEPPENSSNGSTVFMASLVDGSTVRVAVLDEALEFSTPHGPLRVLLRDLRRLELKLRIPDEVNRKIESAAADLGNSDYRRRQAASAILFDFG